MAEVGDRPMQLAEVLQAQVARMAAASALHRAVPEALEADALDSEGVAGMLADRRRALWGRVIPARFQHAEVAHFAPEVAADLDEWGWKPRGRNLVLLGPVGTGKSHAAVAAVRAAHHQHGLDVRFMPVIELLDLLRPGGPEGAMYDLADVDVLVLDDLGAERPTDWTSERLYAVINRRWLEEKPTVATTNLDLDPLCEALGERTYSRLVGSGAVVLRLSGHDRRRKAPDA